MINYLKWDSTFFSKNIYNVFINTSETNLSDFDKIISNLSISNADVAYVVFDVENEMLESKLKDQGVNCIDNKVLYIKTLNDNEIYIDNDKKIEDYRGEDDEVLFNLAIEAGQFSRFKKDENLNSKFNEMYLNWVKNSISGLIADLILVYKIDGKIQGMITGKVENGKAIIGLIATNKIVQGNGIGSKLILAAETAWYKKGVRKIEVATQKENVLAMEFYTKRGYQIKSITPIYHLWLK
jgi:dTDP-4-amino-4,6-dideoxy-D-galactose acyltransferase